MAPSSDEDAFKQQNAAAIERMGQDKALQKRAIDWMVDAERYQYSYHFRWLGRPIIQYPQDLVAIQELVWEIRPDVVVETGIARGGSTIFLASLMQLLGGEGRVIAIDVDIRPHNREAIESHPLSHRVDLIEGSSIDPEIVGKVRALCEGKKVMVILDSNHTHEHVLEELKAYATLVQAGSYLIVLDTVVEDFPPEFFSQRPWGVGDNPKTAVEAFLETSDRFKVDRTIEHKLMLTAAPSGYLHCIK